MRSKRIARRAQHGDRPVAALVVAAALLAAACTAAKPNLRGPGAAAVEEAASPLPGVRGSRPLELPSDRGPLPRHPVIVVPGILGSKLVDPETDRVVWGKLFDLRALTVHESVLQPERGARDGLELPIDSLDLTENRDRLEPSGILDRFSVVPHIAQVRVYQELLAALSSCGYRAGPIASCGVDSDLTVFYYDWRRDLVESAGQLAERIRGIQANLGDPAAKVDIVAHSMGGLIAEYYLLYGGEDVLDRDPLPPPTHAGAANVRKLVLVGVPQEGSIAALRDLHRGLRVGLRPISHEALFTMPALYELLPFGAGAAFVDPEGRPVEVDLADPRVWSEYGLGVFSDGAKRAFVAECRRIFPADWQQRSAGMYGQFERFLEVVLRRASRFRRALLQYASAPPPGVETDLVGSGTRPTAARAELAAIRGGWRVRFDRDSTRAPGDGTVTAASLTWGRFAGPDAAAAGGERFPVAWFDDEHVRLLASAAALRHLTELLAR